jgi:hypothetical protein
MVMVTLLTFGTTQGQGITAEHQQKMLNINISEFPPIPIDSTITPPLSVTFNYKIFLNDTISNPIKINETTTIHFEKKTVMVTGNDRAFLFQIKKKIVEEDKDGNIVHYYCTKGKSLYLVTKVKNGVYFRKKNSYYSTFYTNEEL